MDSGDLSEVLNDNILMRFALQDFHDIFWKKIRLHSMHPDIMSETEFKSQRATLFYLCVWLPREFQYCTALV